MGKILCFFFFKKFRFLFLGLSGSFPKKNPKFSPPSAAYPAVFPKNPLNFQKSYPAVCSKNPLNFEKSYPAVFPKNSLNFQKSYPAVCSKKNKIEHRKSDLSASATKFEIQKNALKEPLIEESGASLLTVKFCRVACRSIQVQKLFFPEILPIETAAS